MSNKQGGCPECGRSDNDQPVTYGSGPFAHPEPGAAADTVYAHVERTVHALLNEIEREAKEAHDATGESARIKLLAEAVQALSSWRPAGSGVALDARFPPACSCGATVFRDLQHHAPDCSGRSYFGSVQR